MTKLKTLICLLQAFKTFGTPSTSMQEQSQLTQAILSSNVYVNNNTECFLLIIKSHIIMTDMYIAIDHIVMVYIYNTERRRVLFNTGIIVGVVIGCT